MALRVKVCSIGDVAEGKSRAFHVTGVTWPVMITQLQGELIATPGVCPHEDVSLADGFLDGYHLVCPGHGYEFDLHTGKCVHDPGLELRRYKITRIADEIWVDLL
ncbi:MAG TPA: Rieske 2Fe-2S domain-containing protein [Kofleriaceae bacterium]|nr:Rieske 2Fe-2S domain-containing protein [Kofleriaceae bacterium]